jgi:hypothetical protein
MGLMQFLAVGRSVDRIDDGSTRYKMIQQNLLPKFGSANRAGRASGESQRITPVALAEPCAADVANPASTATRPDRPSPFHAAAAKALRPGLFRRALSRMGFANVPQAESHQSGKASSAVTRAGSKPRKSFFKNPFSRSPRAKGGRQAVQIELLLDSVKPVCNDLNDSDLEVVTVPAGPAVDGSVKTPSATGAVKLTAEKGEREQSEEPAWGRIKAQVFGAGKS